MKKMFRMVEIKEKDFINIIKEDGITVSQDKNYFQEGNVVIFEGHRFFIVTKNNFVRNLKIKVPDYLRILFFLPFPILYFSVNYKEISILGALLVLGLSLFITYLADYFYSLIHTTKENKLKRKVAEVLKDYVLKENQINV